MFSAYDKIIHCVRSSNLNFASQETPYSLYLTFRKSKVKNSQQSSIPVIDNHEIEIESLVKENLSLTESGKNLKGKLNASEDTTKMLEEKLASIETKALKAHKENIKKDDEIKCLKIVIKNGR